MKVCIECKRKYDENEGRKNPHWCSECDEKRIERIGKQLETLVSHFKKED